VREGSTNADTAGELLSAMGIVPIADGVRTSSSAPLHVRSRAFGPGPNRFPPGYAPRVNSEDRPSLGAGALRALADRHGIRPKRSLGQHFLIDPNMARAIVADAGVGPGDRVVEIGAGLGSLTRALAGAGAEVLAVEVDGSLIPALEGSLSGFDRVRVLHADATDPGWQEALGGGEWVLAANLPYNVATHLVLNTLRNVPQVRRLVVMVQREVGERLVAGPDEDAYGIPSVRVAYRAAGSLVRSVPPSVFWPRPSVESVIVRLERRDEPAVGVAEDRLWAVVDAGFAERRKTMRNALRRLGLEGGDAGDLLRDAGIDPSARAETLSLEEFARIAEALPPAIAIASSAPTS
jgi:16S rRNA (adenine1518-N6/adenine1519-N6)-dimethyltransferase